MEISGTPYHATGTYLCIQGINSNRSCFRGMTQKKKTNWIIKSQQVVISVSRRTKPTSVCLVGYHTKVFRGRLLGKYPTEPYRSVRYMQPQYPTEHSVNVRYEVDNYAPNFGKLGLNSIPLSRVPEGPRPQYRGYGCWFATNTFFSLQDVCILQIKTLFLLVDIQHMHPASVLILHPTVERYNAVSKLRQRYYQVHIVIW